MIDAAEQLPILKHGSPQMLSSTSTTVTDEHVQGHLSIVSCTGLLACSYSPVPTAHHSTPAIAQTHLPQVCQPKHWLSIAIAQLWGLSGADLRGIVKPADAAPQLCW
jgi:hypothetical protein